MKTYREPPRIRSGGDLLGNPPEDRGRMYRKTIVPGEMKRAEDLYNSGLTHVAMAIMTRLDGGNCRICNTPWRRIDVDNVYAKFTYYKPVCSCYPVCRNCGYQMIEEVEGGLSPEICPNCEMR